MEKCGPTEVFGKKGDAEEAKHENSQVANHKTTDNEEEKQVDEAPAVTEGDLNDMVEIEQSNVDSSVDTPFDGENLSEKMCCKKYQEGYDLKQDLSYNAWKLLKDACRHKTTPKETA